MEASIIGQRRNAPNDARQVRSRNALSGALLQLLQEKPFDQLTIREISARAGTGYATFFRHYPTKEALLGDVASEEIANLLARVTTPILHEADSYTSTLELCRYVDKHRKLWFALLTGGAAGIVRDEFLRQARKLARGTTMLQPWLPEDLGVVYGTGATIDLLAWWLAQDTAYAPREIAGILNRLVISPLVGPHADETGSAA